MYSLETDLVSAPGPGISPDGGAETTAPQAPAPTNFLSIDNTPATPNSDDPTIDILPGSTAPIVPATTNPALPGVTNTDESGFTNPDPTGSTIQIPSTNGGGNSALITGSAGSDVYTLGPDGAIYIDGTTFFTNHPTSTMLADGDMFMVGPTGAVTIQKASTHSPLTTLTTRDFVLGAFIPTIVAVIFSIPWRIVLAAVKEMEPFHQLSRSNGSTAEDSMTLDYLASINVIAIFNALRKGHYVVWWAGLISLVVLLIPPLASETIFISTTGDCSATAGREHCFPQLSVFPPAARAVEGILSFIALMTLALIITTLRRRSGVYANPMSITSLATLFQHQSLIEKFRHIHGVSPNAKQLKQALQGSLYRLGVYIEVDGSTRYGLHLLESRSTSADMEQKHSSTYSGNKYTSVAIDPVDNNRPIPKPKRTFSSYGTHPVAMCVFGFFISGLIALIIYYNRLGSQTGFERFMDSNSFGTSFLFTAIGVIIKLYWSLLDDGKPAFLSLSLSLF